MEYSGQDLQAPDKAPLSDDGHDHNSDGVSMGYGLYHPYVQEDGFGNRS